MFYHDLQSPTHSNSGCGSGEQARLQPPLDAWKAVAFGYGLFSAHNPDASLIDAS
jgi:hypothetical protein